HGSGALRSLHSFPTRRSSDLALRPPEALIMVAAGEFDRCLVGLGAAVAEKGPIKPGDLRQRFGEPSLVGDVVEVGRVEHRVGRVDRKSTRLNSSHVKISYAVF